MAPGTSPHDERAILNDTLERCSREFGASVGRQTVRAVVEGAYSRFDDAKVRDFVPLLVEREARRELRERVGTGART